MLTAMIRHQRSLSEFVNPHSASLSGAQALPSSLPEPAFEYETGRQPYRAIVQQSTQYKEATVSANAYEGAKHFSGYANINRIEKRL